MWVRLGEVGLGLLEVRGVLRAKKKSWILYRTDRRRSRRFIDGKFVN